MKALLVDASDPAGKSEPEPGWYYNLGLAKAERWLAGSGHSVARSSANVGMFDIGHFDLAMVSAVFSWDVPAALEAARALRAGGATVEVGGPGFFGVRGMARSHGFEPRVTVDPRFDRQPGVYDAVFWSRGCPAFNCSLGYPKDGTRPVCLVPEMEGSRSTLFPDVSPAPMILDNNLSALPRKHQEIIVERTLSAGFIRVDANSGFEPASFKPATADLWKRLPLVAWRFAYDEIAERASGAQGHRDTRRHRRQAAQSSHLLPRRK